MPAHPSHCGATCRPRLAVAVVAAAALGAHAQASPPACDPSWDTGFGGFAGLFGDPQSPAPPTIRASLVWDDGSGPALFVGGQGYDGLGVLESPGVLRWDGQTWEPFGALHGQVHALTVFDAGDGAQLHASGRFYPNWPDTSDVVYVARFDGISWLDAGYINLQGSALTSTGPMHVFDDGSGEKLFVAGIGRVVQVSDGQAWTSSLATASTGNPNNDAGTVVAFVEADLGQGSRLHAVTRDGTVSFWNGNDWTGLVALSPWFQTLSPEGVQSAAAFDNGEGLGLYIAGAFRYQNVSSSTRARNLLRFRTGEGWSAVPGFDDDGPQVFQPNTSVSSINVVDLGDGPRLVIGGELEIQLQQGVPSRSIFSWDGHSWSPFAFGLTASTTPAGPVRTMSVFDAGNGAELYVGGSLTFASDVYTPGLARWDGSEWRGAVPRSIEAYGLTPRAMAVHDDGQGPSLYVAGVREHAVSTPSIATGHPVARWDGVAWSALPGRFQQQIRALASFDDGSGPVLYAGGMFQTYLLDAPSPVIFAPWLVRWENDAWRTFGGRVNGPVHALQAAPSLPTPLLFIGGTFTEANNEPLMHVGAWDGQAWHDLAGGTNDAVACLTFGVGPEGERLYAAGPFTEAGGQAVVGVAAWDGQAWAAVGELRGSITALAVYDNGHAPALYAAGQLEDAEGLPTRGLARWDGQAWAFIDDVEAPRLFSIETVQTPQGQELYAIGPITGINGQPAEGLAVLRGQTWSPVEGGVRLTNPNPIAAIAAYDDGQGPAVYFGSSIDQLRTSDGQPRPAHRIVKLDLCPATANPCPADLTGPALDGVPDGVVGTSDLNYFLMLWLDQDPAADIAGPGGEAPDGVVNINDLNTYIEWWLASLGSCP